MHPEVLHLFFFSRVFSPHLGTLQIYIFRTANRLWAPSDKPLPPKSFISHTWRRPRPDCGNFAASVFVIIEPRPLPAPPPQTWLPEKFYFWANQNAVVEHSQPIKSLHARRFASCFLTTEPVTTSPSLQPQLKNISTQTNEKKREKGNKHCSVIPFFCFSCLSFWPHFLFPVVFE